VRKPKLCYSSDVSSSGGLLYGVAVASSETVSSTAFCSGFDAVVLLGNNQQFCEDGLSSSGNLLQGLNKEENEKLLLVTLHYGSGACTFHGGRADLGLADRGNGLQHRL
jgi:hypothetical protein